MTNRNVDLTPEEIRAIPPGSVEWFKALIVYLIEKHYEPSFIELLAIPGFTGDVRFGVPELNIFLWPSVSDPAAEALMQLLRDGEIQILPCHPAVYVDAMLDLPIVKTYGKHERPSWLPVKFRPVDKPLLN